MSTLIEKTHKRWLRKKPKVEHIQSLALPRENTENSLKKNNKSLKTFSKASKRQKVDDIRVSTTSPVIIDESEWFNPFDQIIFFGDINYRVELPRLEVINLFYLYNNSGQ